MTYVSLLRYWLLTGACLAMTALAAHAQLAAPPIPPAPTAASLGKFGEVPVSLYIGIPQVEVPLYTIKTKSHTIPLSLSYHASGVRVDEEASPVGLGWALNAGGVITRSVHDTDDLSEFGNSVKYGYATPGHGDIPPWKMDGSNQYDGLGRTQQQYNQDNDYYCSNLQDLQPDVFYYNFQGYNGKFFLERSPSTTNLVVRPQSKAENLLIESAAVMVNNVSKKGWRITTPNGYKYLFGEREEVTARSESTTLLDHLPPGSGSSGNGTTSTSTSVQTYCSAWYLTSITSPDGETVTFGYDRQSSYQTFGIRTQSKRQVITPKYYDPVKNCLLRVDATQTYTTYTISTLNAETAPVLSSIAYATGQVQFTSSARTDIAAGSPFGPAKRLNGMVVYEGSDARFVKGVEFQTSYFDNPANQNGSNNAGYQRLRLDGVREYGAGEKPPYRFTYNYNAASASTSLPRKDSYAKDHYGFFNGALGNDQMGEGYGWGMPYVRETIQIPDESSPSDPNAASYTPYTFETIAAVSADRAYHDPYTQVAVLARIQYPTGGTTDFTFEPNQYYESPTKPAETGPGIRIRTIVSTSEAGAPAQTKRYVYERANGNSSGKRMSREEYYNIEAWEYENGACPSGMRVWILNRFASNTAPMGTAAQGRSIGYDLVTQLEGPEGQNGKTEFYYTNEVETPATPPYIPGTPNSIPPENGLLVRQIVYKCVAPKTASFAATYRKLTETIHIYATNDLYSVKGSVLRPRSCTGPGQYNEFLVYNGAYQNVPFDYGLVNIVKYYDNLTYWQRKSSVIEVVYDQFNEAASTTTTTSYAYGNIQHRQPTQITTQLPDGKVTREYKTYPGDYGTASSVLTAMAGSLHMLTQPVETITTLTRPGGTENVVAGTYLRYVRTGPSNGMAVPTQLDQLRLTAPLPFSSFQRSAPGLTPHPNYQLEQYADYEAATGNMRSMRKADAPLLSYQWGYRSQLPVATFLNADRSMPDPNTPALGNEASYQGFEGSPAAEYDPALDYWHYMSAAPSGNYMVSDAHTGNAAWRVGASLGRNWGATRTFQPARQNLRYKLSAWVKTDAGFPANGGSLLLTVSNTNGTFLNCAECSKEVFFDDTKNGQWQYVEVILDLGMAHTQTGVPLNQTPGNQLRLLADNSTVSNAGYLIDDLRFQPVEAQATTFTYNPESRQPTSMADARSYPTFYEFDGLQRLQVVKDHRRSIQKHFEYHYQRQP